MKNDNQDFSEYTETKMNVIDVTLMLGILFISIGFFIEAAIF